MRVLAIALLTLVPTLLLANPQVRLETSAGPVTRTRPH